MRRKGTRTCGWLLGIAAAAALVGGHAGYGDDKPAPPPCKTPPKARELEPILQALVPVRNCHDLGMPPASQDLKPLCRCNERTFWLHNDKHQDAYAALLGDRAKRINTLRGVSTPPEKDLDCLGCHSMVSVNELGKDKIGTAVIQEGVSCIACHGAYDNWIEGAHGTNIDDKRICWRQMSRKEKEEKWGMTDLWNPVRRTQVCASCHIGDADPTKHRFVNHAMYAGGHPPLPAFETAAFSNSLPRHWQLMNEKTPEMQAQDYHWNPRELEQTKLAVVGEAAAFREAVNLLAKKAEQTPPDQKGWISRCSIAAPATTTSSSRAGGRRPATKARPAGPACAAGPPRGWICASGTPAIRRTAARRSGTNSRPKWETCDPPSQAGRMATPARLRKRARRSCSGRTTS